MLVLDRIILRILTGRVYQRQTPTDLSSIDHCQYNAYIIGKNLLFQLVQDDPRKNAIEGSK